MIVNPTWADDPALTDVTADPATIELGESSALSWTPRADVEAVLISGGGLTEETATGTSHVVMPSETTTYELVAMGEGAELGTFEATVTVNPTWADDPALTDVTADPATIKLGESSALSWTPRADVEAVLISWRRIDRGDGHGHLARRHAERDDHLRAGGHGRRRGAGHVRGHRDRQSDLG